jgi:tetratricopeptide (TPR) repeat protein
VSHAVRFRPGEHFGDLVIERELGRGAFAVVYLARDTVLDRPVALKVLAPTSVSRLPAERDRLLAEARMVAKLASPWIVSIFRVHDLGGAGFVFEMEYMDGGSLADLLERKARLPARDALPYLRAVLQALVVAHGQGVLHRDVKPENVLLDARGDVKLADFGLGQAASEASLSGDGERPLQGTPLYMAPEVVMGERVTAAADLWSAGVVAYRMLAGTLPFHGANLPELFYSIHSEPAKPLDASVPSGLAHVVMACLEKEPRLRPASARALLQELDALQGLPAAREPVPVAAAPPAAEPLVGRRAELLRVESLLEQVAKGRGAALLVTGEAGVGKSALFRDVQRRAVARGFRWIDAPLTPLGGIQRPLFHSSRRVLQALSRSGDLEEQVTASRFGPAAATLRSLFAEGSQALQGVQQTVWALEHLLRGLAKDDPVALYFEDAHFCDPEDVRIVAELVRRLEETPVLLGLAWRTEPAGSGEGAGRSPAAPRALTEIPGVLGLDLSRLPESDVLRLLEALSGAGSVAPEVLERAVERSDGNPLFVRELFRHLLDAREVVVRSGRVVTGPEWGRSETPHRLKDLVSRRLEGLSAEQRTLLDAAAVDGPQFDGEALASVLGLPLLSVLRTLQLLHRERGLITPLRTGFRFGHAVFREVLYAELAPDLRRESHRALALHLESREGARDPERLGLHWELAGRPEKAAPYLASAARAAARRQRYVRALDLARRAGLLAEDLPAERRRENATLYFGLAGALSDLGRHEEARALIGRVLAAAKALGDVVVHDKAAVWAGDLAYWAKGAGAVDVKAVEEAASRLPPSGVQARGFYILGLVAKIRGDVASAQSWLQRAEKAFEKVGEEGDRAGAVHELGDLAKMAGRFEEAEARFKEAARIATSAARRTDAAVSEILRAVSAFERGSPDGAREALADAVHALEMTGARDRASYASVYLARLDFSEGRVAEARSLLTKALEVLEEGASVYGRIEALIDLAYVDASLGDLVHSASLLALARPAVTEGQAPEDVVALEVAETRRLAYLGRAADCEAAAARAIAACRGLPTGSVVPAFLAAQLVECTLFGLPSGACEPLREILMAPLDVVPPVTALARALLDKALAHQRAPADPHGLHGIAGILRRADLGPRQAERLGASHLFAARAYAIERDVPSASRSLEAARSLARRTGNVWFDLKAHQVARSLGDDGSSEGESLLATVAARFSSPAERAHFLAAWRG